MPEIYGAPEEIRTPDLQVRSLLLYPAELRARNKGNYTKRHTSSRIFCNYFCLHAG